jgi:hypothetical protein
VLPGSTKEQLYNGNYRYYAINEQYNVPANRQQSIQDGLQMIRCMIERQLLPAEAFTLPVGRTHD